MSVFFLSFFSPSPRHATLYKEAIKNAAERYNINSFHPFGAFNAPFSSLLISPTGYFLFYTSPSRFLLNVTRYSFFEFSQFLDRHVDRVHLDYPRKIFCVPLPRSLKKGGGEREKSMNDNIFDTGRISIIGFVGKVKLNRARRKSRQSIRVFPSGYFIFSSLPAATPDLIMPINRLSEKCIRDIKP